MVQSTVSIEQSQHPDLENEMAKILQEEIDWEILASVFVKSGWTMVDLERLVDSYHAVNVELWIDENCTGKHMKRGRTFVFEKKQDAEWFILKWL